MDKRGISSIIATVLIIAVTVIIAAGIVAWAMAFSTDIQEGATEKNAQSMLCANSKIKLRFGCLEDDKLNLLIENKGQVDLAGFNIRVIGTASGYGVKFEQPLAIAGISPVSIDYDNSIGTIKSVEVLPMVEVKEVISCAQSEELSSIEPC